jgi:hypothetical protein
MPFFTISKENNVSEKKKGKTLHVLRCGTLLSSLQMLKTKHKNPISLSIFFLARYSTSCQLSQACDGRSINEYGQLPSFR